MPRHDRFAALLATRDDLDTRQREVLNHHLTGCKACQAEAMALEETAAMMKSERREMPPATVRETVLARAAVMPAPRRRWLSRARAAWMGVAALLLAAVVVNSPLPRAVGGAVGWGAAEGPPPGMICLPSGAAIPRWYHVIASPSDYDLGPHGAFLGGGSALKRVQEKIDQPTWYVYTGGGSEAGSCVSGKTIETIQVAINPDAGTELHAIGALKPGVQP